MIVVKLNRPEFEYDIHSLVKAFYPGEAVSATAEEKEYKEPVWLWMNVDYQENSIRIDWKQFVYQEDQENGRKKGQGEPAEEIPLETGAVAVDFSDRTETKNRLKQLLYGMLSKQTGKTLPWGTLTGIRPAKIPMKLLEQGKTREEITICMKKIYLASDEKISLSLDIAERELELLRRIDYVNGYSLYIGIPFCPTTCLYCSFTSYPFLAWAKRVDDYLDALDKEIDFVSKRFSDRRLNSVYIGGGTPTTLEPYQLDRLIRKLKSSFELTECLEFTVEAGRPDSITREKLSVLKQHGISRISINPQTMKQGTLDLIGRRHTVKQTVDSFWLARELGFDNINMDLIMGLPEETLEDVRETLERLSELGPDNITVHSLALKRAARLSMFKEDYKDYKMVNTREHMELTAAYAKKLGLEPYYLYRQKSMAGNLENVGYAKPGKAGVYNILIMEEKQTIMALGAGAMTKFVIPQAAGEVHEDGACQFKIERVENVKDIGNYLQRVDEMIERKIRKMEELSWH